MAELKKRKDLVYAFTALTLIASLRGTPADDKLTQEGLWKHVLGDGTGAPAPRAAPTPTPALPKGKGKEIGDKARAKEDASFFFKRKFLQYSIQHW